MAGHLSHAGTRCGLSVRSIERSFLGKPSNRRRSWDSINSLTTEPGLAPGVMALRSTEVRGKNGYAGVEYSLRDLTVPAFSPASGSFIEGSIQERFARAYLHSTLTTKFALSAEYQMSRFYDPEGSNPSLLQESTTHKLPLQVRFFDRSGLFGRLRLTLFRQEGVFRDKDFCFVFWQQSGFWITDLSGGAWRAAEAMGGSPLSTSETCWTDVLRLPRY